MGITVAGFGLGGVVGPALSQWLVSTSGWRQAYLILCLFAALVIIPVAQFLKHNPHQAGVKPYGADESITDGSSLNTSGFSLTQAMKTSRFWIWGLILFCFFFCIQVVIVHITPYAFDVEIPAMIAASMTSIIAGGSIIGKIAVGFISDRIGTRILLIVCVSLGTLALLWLLFAREIWMLYLFAVVFGIGYGGIVLLQTVITAELFGLASLGMMLAAYLLCSTLGGSLGAPLAGAIFDNTRDYSSAFFICLMTCVSSTILSFILLKAKSWSDSDRANIS